MLEQGGTRGGAQLPLHGPAVGGHPLENGRGGGSGHRQDAVGAPHLAAAHVNGGAQDLLRGQLVKEQAHHGHVGHGVQGAHLVEVDLLHRYPVGAALRLPDELVHPQHVLPHLLGQVQVGEDVADVPHPRVVVMAVVVPVTVVMLMIVPVVVARMLVFMIVMVLMLMVMLVVMVVSVAVGVGGEVHVAAFFLLAVHGDGDVGAGDPALDTGGGGDPHPRQAQGVDPAEEALRIGVKFQQGRGQHVASRAHVAFQIQGFHSDAPFYDRLRKRACAPLQIQK